MQATILVTCKAILFDLDGVLVDSRRCIELAWERWAAGRGMDPAAVLRVAHGRRTTETIREIAPHLDVASEVRILEEIETGETHGLNIVPGALELLQLLPPDRWAIVTSGSQKVASTRIRYCGLPFPAVFVTADDVREGKPSPEGYLKAAAGLSASPEECVVIEDTPAGIQAGIAAGMRTVGILGTHNRNALEHATMIAQHLGDLAVEMLDHRIIGISLHSP